MAAVFSRTVPEVVTSPYIQASPAPPGTGLIINGVPAIPDKVAKADARVDLGSGLTRSLIVEHVTGPCKLLGLTDLIVDGIATLWDFMRPEHRLVYSLGQPNSFVVGPPDGCLNPGFVEAVLAKGTTTTPGPRRRRTVVEEVCYMVHGGYIVLRPVPFGEGVTMNLRLGINKIENFHFDPQEGLDNLDLLRKVVNSPTPFLLGMDDPRAITHALGDVSGDLTGIGGFTDLYVESTLSFYYHALTIGAVRKARIREWEG